MKQIIKIVGAVVILGAVSMASTPIEISTANKMDKGISTDTSWYCDPIERLMGMCRSSQTLPFEN